jgi:hypothetical protein
MQLARPAVATDPRTFGRGMFRELATRPAAPSIAADLRLFALTFVGGFVFVSLLIA